MQEIVNVTISVSEAGVCGCPRRFRRGDGEGFVAETQTNDR